MMSLVAALLLQDEVSREFVYVADKGLTSVFLAGGFNGWNKGATPLKVDADGRTWRVTVKLGPGKHSYKFVLDDKDWIVDPKAEKNEDDGGGNTNSILFIFPPGYETPAVAGDGTLTLGAIRHGKEVSWRNFDGDRLILKLRVRKGDVERASVKLEGKLYPMRSVASDEFYETYRVDIPNQAGKGQYRFELVDKSTRFFGPEGLSETPSSTYSLAEIKPFETPDWAQGMVLYHIFPERFLNGDKSNDPANVIPWGSKPEYYNWMGGDLAGVKQKADYLASLGVGGIYFNPLFEGPSNHGYETTDYLKIAKHFGTNQEFADLTRDFKKRGIRTILDGVFNHTSVDFYAFKDLREKGGNSSYRNWFFPKSFPIKVGENPNYEAWFGFPSMPKLNLANPDTRKALLDVPRFWDKNAEIAGWRLDVANEVSMDYWRDFRKTVKNLGKDRWIIGEHWGDGSGWLQGDQWDSMMGYQFRDAALRFFVDKNLDAGGFMGRLISVYESYPPQVSRNLMTLLSSHDTPRFKTLAKDDDLTLLAATVLLTWPGSPSVYYGEEIGMDGGADPENRRAMTWEAATEDNRFLKHYRTLIKARAASKALQVGEPQIHHAGPDIFVYTRQAGKSVAVIFGNRSGEAITLKNGGPTFGRAALRDVFTGERINLAEPITIPAKGARVFVD